MADLPLNQQSDELILLNLYRQALAQLTIMQRNVNTLNSPVTVKTIPMGSGNLYKVAAQEYGDPSKWTVIADANNLSDPEITSFINLIIPVLTNAAS